MIALAVGIAAGRSARADAIDDLVKAQLTSQNIPGVAIVAIKAGKVTKVGAYGVAEVEHGTPVTADTIFRLESLSKPFTATGVMLLVEDGKIGLDDPIERYLPGGPESWRKITVRHLLTQTSGLRDFVNEPTGTPDLFHERGDESLRSWAAGQSLKFAPGDAWDYSNTNYLLLGMIISRVSGRWYGDFLAERIFLPLGMTRTSVPRQPAAGPDTAKGYELEKSAIQRAPILAPSVSSYGGGGMQSTVNDLAKWELAVESGRFLNRETLDQMWTPVKLNDGTTHGYGMGWEIDAAPHRRIWHGGRWIGFATQLDRFVDDQLTVIVLTNLADATPARITRAIAGTFVLALAEPVYRPIPDGEPAVTKRFFDVLRRAHEGNPRAQDFTEPVWAYIASRIEQMKRDFIVLGPIQQLTLVERTDASEGRSYRYRARFSHTSMIFHFVLTADDRIAVMLPEQINQ